jgi:hypothetical protein
MPNMTPKKSIKKYTGKGKPTFNKKTGAVQIKYPGANIVGTK